MCNRLHISEMKGATSEAVLTLIDGPPQDNLPVQPVAQRRGIKRSHGACYQPALVNVLSVHRESHGDGTRKSNHQKESA